MRLGELPSSRSRSLRQKVLQLPGGEVAFQVPGRPTCHRPRVLTPLCAHGPFQVSSALRSTTLGCQQRLTFASLRWIVRRALCMQWPCVYAAVLMHVLGHRPVHS